MSGGGEKKLTLPAVDQRGSGGLGANRKQAPPVKTDMKMRTKSESSNGVQGQNRSQQKTTGSKMNTGGRPPTNLSASLNSGSKSKGDDTAGTNDLLQWVMNGKQDMWESERIMFK